MKLFANWVLHSSTTSVRDRRPSVLAVAETIIAVIGYWFLANTWLLLLGALVAPLLLMRSAPSKELGKAWLKAYWQPKRKRWEQFDSSEKIILTSLTTIAAGATTVLLLAELPHSWDLGSRSAIAGAIGILGAGMVFLSIECDLDFEGSTFETFAGIFLGGICGTAVGAWLFAGEYASVLAGLTALSLATIGFNARSASGPKGLAGTQQVTLSIVFFAIPYMLAVFLRITAIRVCATLRYLPEGIKAMPDNWAENSVRMDVCYPASILPEAHEVSEYLTVKGLLKQVREGKTPLAERTIYVFSILLYALPANLYRLSLKSTLWAWWPLLFFLKPVFDGMSDDARENRTKMTTSWATKSMFILAAYYVLVYLVVRLDMQFILNIVRSMVNGEVQDNVGRVSSIISVPPLGIIWWGLLFGSVAVFILFSYSTKINTLYWTDLDTGRLELLSARSQEEFKRLSLRQEIWRRVLMFAIIQMCWWSSLYLVQRVDPDFMRVRIPEQIWSPMGKSQVDDCRKTIITTVEACGGT